MYTISIKLGKRVHTFNIQNSICGIIITNQDNDGIILELAQRGRKGDFYIYSNVREVDFFAEELAEIAIKFIKKNKSILTEF
jgi:hypothetical protein